MTGYKFLFFFKSCQSEIPVIVFRNSKRIIFPVFFVLVITFVEELLIFIISKVQTLFQLQIVLQEVVKMCKTFTFLHLLINSMVKEKNWRNIPFIPQYEQIGNNIIIPLSMFFKVLRESNYSILCHSWKSRTSLHLE